MADLGLWRKGASQRGAWDMVYAIDVVYAEKVGIQQAPREGDGGRGRGRERRRERGKGKATGEGDRESRLPSRVQLDLNYRACVFVLPDNQAS